MASTSDSKKDSLVEWLQMHCDGSYRSCIKIHGQPILPPVMTEHRREEMCRLREMAVEVEKKLHRRKESCSSQDSANREALYESAVDELQDATSSTTCEGGNHPGPTCHSIEDVMKCDLKTSDMNLELSTSVNTSDMLKEFDPLVSVPASVSPSELDRLLNSCSFERNVSSGFAVSKPGSAESSVTLSNSTDLNNYMDVTESSVDVSTIRSDIPATGTVTATPNTIRPDSDLEIKTGCESAGNDARLDGITTYEDLNKYLDIILNNSTDSIQFKAVRELSSSDESYPVEEMAKRMKKQNARNEAEKNHEDQKLQQQQHPPATPTAASPPPPPLTMPIDSLQTKTAADNKWEVAPKKSNINEVDSFNFLEDCALSPVRRSEGTELVHQGHPYFREFQVIMGTFPQTKSAPQSIVYTDNNLPGPNADSMQVQSQDSSNQNHVEERNLRNSNINNVEPPPRLVRSNSYTLDTPSPLLLAHIESELKKSNPQKQQSVQKNKPPQSQTTNCSVSSRIAWGGEKSKSTPSWVNRQGSASIHQVKKDSNTQGMKTPKKALSQNNSLQFSSLSGSGGRTDVNANLTKSPKLKSTSSNPSSTRSKQKKTEEVQVTASVPPSISASPARSTSVNAVDAKENLRLLLTELQLQHTREMEALLNRQRKEQETIRLALSEGQRLSLPSTGKSSVGNELSQNQSSGEVRSYSDSSSGKSHHTTGLECKQSSVDTGKGSVMERRNTSPSLYKGKSSEELHGCLVQYNKSSSISLEDVSSNSGETMLINIECDSSASNDHGPHSDLRLDCVSALSSQSISDGGRNLPCNAMKDDASRPLRQSTVQSTFTSTDQPTNIKTKSASKSIQNKSMTSSLPPELLMENLLNAASESNNTHLMVYKTEMSSAWISSYAQVPASHVQQSLMSSSLPSNTALIASAGENLDSPRHKRRSWCSRQLFSDDTHNKGNVTSGPDWVVQPMKHLAAAKVQAGVRGYLTRRLLKTERVQNCITTIRDTIVCALQLQRECAPHVEASDLQLHGRLIQQLSAACEDLHNIFHGLPVEKRMAIIAADREWLRNRTPRSATSGTNSRPLSRATQIALQRKLHQGDISDTASLYSTSSTRSRSRRRSWATVDIRPSSRPSPSSMSATTKCEVVAGCLSQSSAPVGNALQRSASTGSQRRPWR